MKTKLRLLLAASVGLATVGLAAPEAIAADQDLEQLLITGSVVRAKASYATDSGNMDHSSLSSVTNVSEANVELMWVKPDYRDEGAGAKVGNTEPMQVVASARADSAGRYAISGRPTVDMINAAKQNDGWINFWLATWTGADYVLEGVSRQWDGTRWTSFGDQRPGMSPKDVHQTVFAVDVRTGQRKFGQSQQLLNKTAKSTSLGVQDYPSGCELIVRSYEYKHTVVMEFHNTADADGHWEYGGTADSDIEVGVQYNGANWTIGSTQHVGNSGGSAIGYNTSALFGKYVATNFRYKRGQFIHSPWWWCSYNGDNAIVPDRWEGGGMSFPGDVSVFDCLDSPQSSYREQYQIGGYFRKFEARAAKIGNAASFAGINLGSTSGYSSRVDMDWRAVRNWIYICGSDAYPRYAKIVYTY